MDFGWPNAEIGRKMANGWLLFLALLTMITTVNLDKLNYCTTKLFFS